MRKWISIAATLLTLSYAHADTPPARAINAETYDAAGNGITSHLNGSNRGLDEYNINPVGSPINTQIIWSGSVIDPRQVSVANFPATQNVSVTNASLAVTGTVTANIGTTNGLALDSTTQNTQGSASGGAAASKSDLAGGIYNATPPTLTNGQQASLQFNSSGSLKVDGSAFTQPVSGSVSVSNFPASQTVNGSVSVSNFPATQPVSGSVSVSNLPSLQSVKISDGTLNTTLLNSAPVSDTGQVAVPVRVISQLGAGSGGGSASIGSNGAAAPTFSDQMGAEDSLGKLQPLSITATGSLKVDNSANTQPISAASLPIPTGASTAANQSTANTTLSAISGQLPVALDGSGDLKVHEQGTANVSVQNFPAIQTVSGSVNVGNLPSLQPVQVSDGTLNLALLNSAPASDTGQTAIPVRVISQLGAGSGGSSGASFALQTDTFAATGSGTTVDAHTGPVKFYSLQVVATGSVSSWIVVLDCSMDGVNFSSIPNLNATSGSGSGAIQFTGGAPYPCAYFRSRVTTLNLGTGTNIVVTVLGQN